MNANFLGKVYEESIRDFLLKLNTEDIICSTHLIDVDFNNDNIDLIIACIESLYYEVLCLNRLIENNYQDVMRGYDRNKLINEFTDKLDVLKKILNFEPIFNALVLNIKNNQKRDIYDNSK